MFPNCIEASGWKSCMDWHTLLLKYSRPSPLIYQYIYRYICQTLIRDSGIVELIIEMFQYP